MCLIKNECEFSPKQYSKIIDRNLHCISQHARSLRWDMDAFIYWYCLLTRSFVQNRRYGTTAC